MHLTITPLDPVFFRDGKAFTMGEESQAEGLFPPPPSVLCGALRTRYFAEHPGALADAATDDDPTRHTRLKGLALRRGPFTYFPLPADLVRVDGEDDQIVVPLRPQPRTEGLGGSSPVGCPLAHPAVVETPRDAYLDQNDLAAYLTSAHDPSCSLRYHRQPSFVASEPKIGIKMNRGTRGAQKGHLYRVGFRRLREGVSVSAHVDGLELPSEGLLKLGGEGRAAHFAQSPQPWPHPEAPLDTIQDRGTLKLYLATPAFFEAGWHPSWIDADTGIGTIAGCTVTMYAAAVGKPIYLGGWDMKARAPKPMLKGVPAGSVYYLRVDEGDPAALFKACHGQSISEAREQAGFGLCYAGAAMPAPTS